MLFFRVRPFGIGGQLHRHSAAQAAADDDDAPRAHIGAGGGPVVDRTGVGDELAHSSLRLSLGRWTTEEEIRYAVQGIEKAVTHLRTMSPLWDLHKEGIDISKIVWQAH